MQKLKMKNVKKIVFLLIGVVLMSLITNNATAESAVNEKLYNQRILYVTEDATTTADNSTYGNTGSVTSGTWITQTQNFQVGDKATQNTAGGTITFTNISEYQTANFTVCLWTNLSVTDPAGGRDIIAYHSLANSPFWRLEKNNDNANLQFYYKMNEAGDAINIFPIPFSANSGTMSQICVSVNDTNAAAGVAWGYVYINGSEVIATQISPSGARGTWQPHNIILGSNANTNNQMSVGAVFDEIIIWNVSLTKDEINETYMLGANGTTLKTIASDIKFPEINISLNNTALVQGFVVNVTGNWSDDIGGDTCQIIINQSAGVKEYFNFSLSGTSGYCGQNITIAVGVTNIINFTARINDTSNKFSQSELLISMGDITPPSLLYINFSKFSIVDGNRLNVTINVSDIGSNLFRIKYNLTKPDGTKTQRLNPTNFQIPSEKNYILNDTLFAGDLTSAIGIWNLTYVSIEDIPLNIVEDYPNITFEVTSAPSGGTGGTTEGGGGGTQATIVITKNETIITGQCNFNSKCEPQFGEDSFNCNVGIGGDCEAKFEEILPTCLLDKNQQCVWRTAIVGRIALIAVIISFLILLSDTQQGRKVRKVLKERLNINLLKE